MSSEGSEAQAIPEEQKSRMFAFAVVQVVFLAVSPLAGGFHYEMWSMLDSSILVLSLGLTGLAFVLIDTKVRKAAITAALVLYVLGVLDISINILLSGWIGWAEQI
jgi:hypothetical protein